MIDFTQLGINSIPKKIDPRDIFMSLTGKDSKYQYLRDVQGEVLKQWFEIRNNKDSIIKMNTGSGKTVVALLILQSCLNEGVGPALYVVPDKYLVEQVCSQAKAIGIEVVDTETDLRYQRKKAILVVNIQKLVNGKSVFGLRDEGNYSIGSVIIDDMHACISSIQEQFSITIQNNNEMYKEFVDMFADDMKKQAEGRFEDIISSRNPYGNMMVPFWAWQKKNPSVYKVLSEKREDDSLKFKFGLISNSLPLSRCYISSREISIIPFCTPIHIIRSFDAASRRVYLSATLPDDSPFSTVMGLDFKDKMMVISPEKANDIGERLIIVPKIINRDITESDMRSAIARQAEEYNVVVLVPSNYAAKAWEDLGGTVLNSANISAGVNTIKKNSHGLYAFVNRYDGIDLPDDACRIIVVDGLPNISNMNDKYEQEVVRKSERIQREQVQRIEQGMGRGVRSSADYCLIYLLGDQLTNVLYANDGYNFFSDATKAQFKLSEMVCDQIEGEGVDKIIEIGDALLKRDKNWIEVCKNATSMVEYRKEVNISQFAICIREAFNHAMSQNYREAIKTFNDFVNTVKDPRLKGYYKQMLAEYTNFVDENEAQQILKSGKRDNTDILNPLQGIQFEKFTERVTSQAQSVIDYLNEKKLDSNKLILRIDAIISDLKFVPNSSKRFEQAIKDVFEIIGFKAKRPETECGKGPDDFVMLGDGEYLVVECKNETVTDTICKDDCNQLMGSYSWFNNLYQDETAKCTPIMIHNSNIFNYECSPVNLIRIMTPSLLEKFTKNVRSCMVAITQAQNYKNLEQMSNLFSFYKIDKASLVSEYTTDFRIKNNR